MRQYARYAYEYSSSNVENEYIFCFSISKILKRKIYAFPALPYAVRLHLSSLSVPCGERECSDAICASQAAAIADSVFNVYVSSRFSTSLFFQSVGPLGLGLAIVSCDIVARPIQTTDRTSSTISAYAHFVRRFVCIVMPMRQVNRFKTQAHFAGSRLAVVTLSSNKTNEEIKIIMKKPTATTAVKTHNAHR